MKAKIISGQYKTHHFANGSIVLVVSHSGPEVPDNSSQFEAVGFHCDNNERVIRQWLIQEEFEVIPE